MNFKNIKITNPEDGTYTSFIEAKTPDITKKEMGEDEHWRDVRERAAVAAMQVVMTRFGSIEYNKETIAKLAVEQADALIDKLKKK